MENMGQNVQTLPRPLGREQDPEPAGSSSWKKRVLVTDVDLASLCVLESGFF